MQQGMAGPVTDKQKEFLGDISDSSNHLLTLITDILDLSKVEAGKLDLEPGTVSLKEIIEGSLSMFKEKALKHAITATSEIDDTITSITADQRKLKQIIVNLLSNAFKFTPDGGSVHVAARRVVRDLGLGVEKAGVRGLGLGVSEKGPIPSPQQPTPDRDFIEISVTDTGIGISKENQQRLFQSFQQIETSLTRKYAGTGLGLSLCRRLVELHGGRIWVESEPGKGSKFVFIIPMKQ
jgi:signal transduction histidine kinase